jgi:hypothetical protein
LPSPSVDTPLHAARLVEFRAISDRKIPCILAACINQCDKAPAIHAAGGFGKNAHPGVRLSQK